MADSVERTPAVVLEGEAGKGRPRGQQVVEILRSAIITGGYEPGERLIEATLSTELGTSRGPVREALRQLENEGLVMSFPYRGAVVLGVSDEEVQEVLIPIRLTLERYSFMHALDRITEEEFAELGKQVWLMEQAAAADDLARHVEADLRFHEIVISASGQTHTVQIWRTIWPRIRAYFYRYGRGQDRRRARQETSWASSVILVFSRREIGQPVFALLAAVSNAALSAPGIFATSLSWTSVTVKPASSFSNVTVAVVSIDCAVRPALPSWPDSAIEKQPAWAAAISSSGLVPLPFSKRVLNEYCVPESTPLSVETVPLPSLRPPSQWADALRFMASPRKAAS